MENAGDSLSQGRSPKKVAQDSQVGIIIWVIAVGFCLGVVLAEICSRFF